MEKFRTIQQHTSDIKFELNEKNIAPYYYFDDEVLKSTSGSTKGHNFSNDEKLSQPNKLYLSFLKILDPLFIDSVPPSEWIGMIDRETSVIEKWGEQANSIHQMLEYEILQHASNFGFGYTSSKAMRSMLKRQGLEGCLFVPQLPHVDEDNPNHLLTKRSILLHALAMYEAINTDADEMILDDVIVDFINDQEANIKIDSDGAYILVDGYWNCLWWSFALDENRLKASKCGNCNKLLVRTKRAKYCNSACRSAVHYANNKVDKNNKYDRKTIQLKTESLKLLIKDAKKLNDEIGSEQREKALKKLDEALESLGKVPNE